MEKEQNSLSEKIILKKVPQVNEEYLKPPKQPVFFVEKAMMWQSYLERILKDQELLTILESINYTEKSIKATLSSLKQLLGSIEQYHVNMERKKNITKSKNSAIEESHKVYMYHKTLVQNLFRYKPHVIGSLRADQVIPQRESLWIRNVKQFYLQIIDDENALKALLPYKIDKSVIKTCLQNIEIIEKTIIERNNLSKELINLTADNADKKGTIVSWMSTFRQIARRGLVDNQAVLNKLDL